MVKSDSNIKMSSGGMQGGGLRGEKNKSILKSQKGS